MQTTKNADDDFNFSSGYRLVISITVLTAQKRVSTSEAAVLRSLNIDSTISPPLLASTERRESLNCGKRQISKTENLTTF